MSATTVATPRAVWVRLKPAHLAQLQALAEADDRPIGGMARRLLVDALERHTPKNAEGSMT